MLYLVMDLEQNIKNQSNIVNIGAVTECGFTAF